MTNRSERFASIGLALTLGSGLLHAQPAGHEGRGADVPRGVGEVQSVPPVLNEPRSLAGMNLDFTGGAKLGEILANMSKQSGISIILHTSVSAQGLSTSADLRGMGFQRALDTLMLQNDLFYKVMDPSSIMVFKKTPQNLQEFETKHIKTFYLANADVDAVRQTLNALMPQLRVFIDKRLNAVTLSGNPGEEAKAQQVVNNLDRARGEVRLQMELIEVGQKASASAGLLTNGKDANAVAPDQAVAKVMQDPGSKLLASPDVRVIAGEAAEVRIGRKLAPAQAGGEAKPAGQGSQGVDLGVKIKVKPRLHPNHELTLDVEYEITDPLEGGDPGRPTLGERVVKTSVHMKDGETLVLGGLLEDEGRDRAQGGAPGGKEKKYRLLVVKAVVLRWGDQ